MREEENRERDDTDDWAQPTDLLPGDMIAALCNGEERHMRCHGQEADEIRVRTLAPVHADRAEQRDKEQAAEENEPLRVAACQHVRACPEHHAPHNWMSCNADDAARGLLALQQPIGTHHSRIAKVAAG